MNPFVFNAPVAGDDFINREEIIAAIEAGTSGKSQGNVWITSARQTGKTSLLRKIQAMYASKNKAFVHYETGGQKKARYLIANVQDCTHADAFYDTLRQVLKNEFDYKLSFKDCNTSHEKFVKAIRYLFEKEDAYVVLLIDEFDACVANLHATNKASVEVFMAQLNKTLEYTGNTCRMWSAVFTSNHSLQELYTKLELKLNGSGLVVHEHELPLFSQEQSATLARTYLQQDLNVSLTDKEIAICYELSKGYPILLQMALYQVYVAKSSGQEVKIAVQAYRTQIQKTTETWGGKEKMPERTKKLLQKVFSFVSEKGDAILSDFITDIDWNAFITSFS